jgi:hypothetical protein
MPAHSLSAPNGSSEQAKTEAIARHIAEGYGTGSGANSRTALQNCARFSNRVKYRNKEAVVSRSFHLET